jgi:hypothetical protein
VGNVIVKIAFTEERPPLSLSFAEYKKATQYSLKDRFKGILYLILNLQFNWSLKSYLKGHKQAKNPVYSMSVKERILLFYTYLFNINKRKVFFSVNGKNRIDKELWMSSEKYFSAVEVNSIAEKILEIQKKNPDSVSIRSSSFSDFVLGDGDGNSVIIEQLGHGK